MKFLFNESKFSHSKNLLNEKILIILKCKLEKFNAAYFVREMYDDLL